MTIEIKCYSPSNTLNSSIPEPPKGNNSTFLHFAKNYSNKIKAIHLNNSINLINVPEPPKGHKSYFFHFSKHIKKIRDTYPIEYKKKFSHI